MADLQPPPSRTQPLELQHSQKRSQLQSSNPSISPLVATCSSPSYLQSSSSRFNLMLQPFCGHEDQLLLLRNVPAVCTMTKRHGVRHWRGMWREDKGRMYWILRAFHRECIYITIVHRNHDGNHNKVHLRRHHFDDLGLLGDCTAVWDTATNGDLG